MKQLTVSVDEVASLRYVLNDSDFDPVQYAMLCEVAGVRGICMTLGESDRGISERDAQLARRVLKNELNLHLRPHPQSVKMALSVNPNMVTFVEVPDPELPQLAPLSEEQIAHVLPELIPDLHANNISVAVFAVAEISTLKHLGRAEVDYVQFDCSEITLASDSNAQILAVDKLNTAVMAASKLGMGVNCYGEIDYIHLPALAAISRIEDICMGMGILKRALYVGIERAVHEALEQILHYQKD